jgi:hypothetical protein
MARIRIPLTQTELDHAFNIAKQRNQKEKRFGAMTYENKRGGLEAHRIGIVAEAAIAKLFNTKLDQKIYELSGDSGVDLVLPNVGECAVKATTYHKKPYLRAEVEHHRDDIGAYIACYVNPKTYDVWFIGWISGEELDNKEIEQGKLTPNGPLNYIVREHQLHDPQELVELVCLDYCVL